MEEPMRQYEVSFIKDQSKASYDVWAENEFKAVRAAAESLSLPNPLYIGGTGMAGFYRANDGRTVVVIEVP